MLCPMVDCLRLRITKQPITHSSFEGIVTPWYRWSTHCTTHQCPHLHRPRLPLLSIPSLSEHIKVEGVDLMYCDVQI